MANEESIGQAIAKLQHDIWVLQMEAQRDDRDEILIKQVKDQLKEVQDEIENLPEPN